MPDMRTEDGDDRWKAKNRAVGLYVRRLPRDAWMRPGTRQGPAAEVRGRQMRMWMVDPHLMCRKHLLGEHVELHMMTAWLAKGRKVNGWADSNCLEPRAIGSRHTVLVKEMIRRGYTHKSPLAQPIIG